MKSGNSLYSIKFAIQNFFTSDTDSRKYLQSIVQFSERQQTYLLLEINSIASRPSNFIAISHLDLLPIKNFALAYCFDSFVEQNCCFSQDKEIKSEYLMDFEIEDQLPLNTFAIVPMNVVQDKIKNKKSESECSDESKWKKVLDLIHANIEQDFPIKRWKNAKSLAFLAFF